MNELPTSADWPPPVGTAARIRNRAIWAVTLFAASVPPAILSLSTSAPAETAQAIAPLALGFWLLGFLLALWAAIPTLRYWDGLPQYVRWLGALPLVSVSLFITAALIAALFA